MVLPSWKCPYWYIIHIYIYIFYIYFLRELKKGIINCQQESTESPDSQADISSWWRVGRYTGDDCFDNSDIVALSLRGHLIRL